MKKNGARIIVEPVIGFVERLFAFLYINMKQTKCNLIELVEAKQKILEHIKNYLRNISLILYIELSLLGLLGYFLNLSNYS